MILSQLGSDRDKKFQSLAAIVAAVPVCHSLARGDDSGL
jgi:hypothetical protein